MKCDRKDLLERRETATPTFTPLEALGLKLAIAVEVYNYSQRKHAHFERFVKHITRIFLDCDKGIMISGQDLLPLHLLTTEQPIK